MRKLRPIHTESNYHAAFEQVSAYFDNEPEPGSDDGDRFEILATLIEAYEGRHFPMLNRKRPLSLPMIRSLHFQLGIPAATLVREPQLIALKKLVGWKLQIKRISGNIASSGTRFQTTKATSKQPSKVR